MRTTSLSFVAVICLSAFAACESTPDGTTDVTTGNPPPAETPPELDLPSTPYNYADLDLPAHYTTDFALDRDNTPSDNPVTDHGATLGRVLFHDKTLSANGTVACASCHAQEHGFTDPAKFSVGFEGGHTGRNSMSLIDARYYRNGRFFWDERAATLEDQVLMPIQNEVEMGLTLGELVARVESKSYYAPLFTNAFGSPEVSSERISKALAQFVRSIVSYRSRFDEGLAAAGLVGSPFPNFTAQENQGKALFLGPATGCAACHLDSGPPPPPPGPRPNQAFFFIDVATNNGLDADTSEDNGAGDITMFPPDDGRFKSPSLRNVALTAPYMHDGRFATLAEVVEHYNSGVQAHPNLDPRLRVPGSNPPEPRRLDLSDDDKAALVAFLDTLTDAALVADPKYSSPFLADKP
jgi:cytochrome c peroxidase